MSAYACACSATIRRDVARLPRPPERIPVSEAPRRYLRVRTQTFLSRGMTYVETWESIVRS